MIDDLRRTPRHRWLACVLPLALAACADAAKEDADAGFEQPCEDGYRVANSGECNIPRLGPGEIETPDEPFVAPEIDNSDLDEARGFFLNQEGEGKFRVYVNETITIGVRAITNTGQPAQGHRVTFAIDPDRDPAGSALSNLQADTNEFGVAHVDVIAGPRPTQFFILMSAPDTTGLRYTVDVLLPPEGRGDVEPNPPPDGHPGDPGGLDNGHCLETEGVYDIINRYEPARFLGDGPFQVLDTIHQALSNPGRFAADLIADRIDGIWGAVIRGAIEPVVNYVVDYVLQNYAPDWVRWMAILVEDITGVLTELEIQGTLELGPVDQDTCQLTGRHRWERLVFLWRAGCPAGDDQCGRYQYDLAQLGVGLSESEFDATVLNTLGPVADLQIQEHSLQLNLGVAVIFFIENVILPQRLNVRSFGELIGLVIPCDAVGALAADYLSGIPIVGFAVAPFVERACQAGLEAMGNWLTRQLTDQFNVDTFPMAGQCKMRDNNGDRAADVLSEGRWTQGLEGDFTAQRRQ